MKTYKGSTQRTTNGRWLYGRTGNYRLRSCLTCEVNYNYTLATQTAPITGQTTLVVASVVAAATPGSLTPGINSNWPAPAAGGMSSPNTAGGIAVQNSGYARENNPSAITVTKTWVWGDATASAAVAFGSSTNHTYAPGLWVPTFLGKDALGRTTTQTLPSVGVLSAAPLSPAAVGGTLQISLSWLASDAATSYNIYRSTTTGGVLALIGSSTGLTFVDAPLAGATQRFYKIAAVNAAGEGVKSAEVNATTL